MDICKATMENISTIYEIYDEAREYMWAHGNLHQWDSKHPSKAVIEEDIRNGNCYVIVENDMIYGVFAFIIGDEPTYQVIEKGKWNSDKTYGTIHRLASNGQKHGIARCCFTYCDSQMDYLRIDTHADNKTMQAAIKDFGFEECGTIYVSNGERIAYDRIRIN